MKTCALYRQMYLKQSHLSQINEITNFNLLLRPNNQIFKWQLDLVGDLAFPLCAPVGKGICVVDCFVGLHIGVAVLSDAYHDDLDFQISTSRQEVSTRIRLLLKDLCGRGLYYLPLTFRSITMMKLPFYILYCLHKDSFVCAHVLWNLSDEM